jgi:hypothetical protein
VNVYVTRKASRKRPCHITLCPDPVNHGFATSSCVFVDRGPGDDRIRQYLEQNCECWSSSEVDGTWGREEQLEMECDVSEQAPLT